jgi:signal transduction histidine kinase/CheY-like chemotaxis protein
MSTTTGRALEPFPPWLTGRGEVGALLRAIDWANTRLGTPDRWPGSLRSALALCLGSHFPAIIFWGRDLVQIYNDAFRPILGAFKHPRAMGQRGAECWPEAWAVAGPLIERVLLTGEPTWAEDQPSLVNRNGYAEECFFTFANTPIRNESGRVGGVFAVVTETTRRVLAERRLRTLYDLSVQALDAPDADRACVVAAAALAGHPSDLPWGLLYLAEGEHGEARLAAHWGMNADEAASVRPHTTPDLERPSAVVSAALARVGRTGTTEIVGDLRGLWASADGAAAQGQSALIVAMPPATARADGLLAAGISAHLALDDDYRVFIETAAARVGHAVGHARSCERERRAHRAAVEANGRNERLIATLSHELRGPLQTVRTAVYFARLEGATPALLSAIDAAVAHQVRLVNDLMELSRLAGGQLRVHCRLLELRAASAAAVEAIAPEAAVRGVRVELVEGAPAMVLADAERLRQMIWNLLSNAVKFTGAGGRVAVSVTPGERETTLAVADNGRGIGPEYLPHIFEQFSQEVRPEGAQRGLGLGLSIVKQLAELQDVLVGAESAGPGRGSTFTLRFPVPPLTREVSAGAPEAPPERRPLTGKRVCVVEGSAVAREVLLRALEIWGATAEGVGSVEQALEVIPTLRPHVIVSELNLPGRDGHALARAVRGAGDPTAAMIALTAVRAPAQAQLARAAGFDAVLLKPADPDELRHVLARLRPLAA